MTDENAPIPLSREILETIRTWATDDRLWGSRSATEFNLCTFARVILKTELAAAQATITALRNEIANAREACPVVRLQDYADAPLLALIEQEISQLFSMQSRAEKAEATITALSQENQTLKDAKK